MAVKLNSELAAFFETGDQPSEAEFGHLIDSILPAPVLLPTSTDTLVKATHQGRVCVAGDVGSNIEYTIPQPAAAGEWYKFIYGGAAVEAQHHKFIVASAVIKGLITFFDTTADENAEVRIADGTDDTQIQLQVPQSFEVNMISYSSTVWYMWGWVTGGTIPTVFS